MTLSSRPESASIPKVLFELFFFCSTSILEAEDGDERFIISAWIGVVDSGLALDLRGVTLFSGVLLTAGIEREGEGCNEKSRDDYIQGSGRAQVREK